MFTNIKAQNSYRKQSGFTLIELIVYIALVSIFMTGAILFTWDLIYSREKSHQNQIVQTSARIVMSRIAYEIRRAQDIKTITGSSVELTTDGPDTLITRQNNDIYLTAAGQGPFRLNSNQTTVSYFNLIPLISTDNNSKSVYISLVVQSAAGQNSAHFSGQASWSQTVSLNSRFNQARALLTDATYARLTTANRNLEDIAWYNSGNNDITAASLRFDWSGGDPDSKLQNITVNNQTVWSGTAGSGETIDITDVVIPAGELPVNINRFGFSRSMADSTLFIQTFLADQSISYAQFFLSSSVGPPPTVTPTIAAPTPTVFLPTNTPMPTAAPITCAQYCSYLYNNSGTCIKSKDCAGTNAGRIYECSSPNICCCQ